MFISDPCVMCGKKTNMMEIDPRSHLTYCKDHSESLRREYLISRSS